MRRLLIVAYYFPPIGGIGSIRLASLAGYLPEFGWEPTVLAPGRTPHPHDPSLTFPAEKVVRSRSIEPSRLAGAHPQRGAAGGDRARSVRSAVRAAARRAIYPDAQIGWYPGAVAAGLRMSRDRSFDAVYSSSVPVTAHLVARTLSRRRRLPWVAEFRDPLGDRLAPDHPHGRRTQALEGRIGRQATQAIMPTPTWAAHFGDLWGIDIAVVSNGHELERVSSPAPAAPVLAYLGSFNPGRQSLVSLWNGVEGLRRRGLSPMPRVRFIGDLHPAAQEEAVAAGLEGLVEATGVVPHEAATALLDDSSMLFTSGDVGRDAIARGWVPAKLFEYLATGLPILYVGDPAGDAWALLSGQPGCYVVEPADVEGITSALEAGLNGPRTHDREVSHLSRRAAAATLAAILDRATVTTASSR